MKPREDDRPQEMQSRGTHRVHYSTIDAIPAKPDSRITAASPLRDGPFLLEAAGIRVGDIILRVGRNSPLLIQGTLPADLIWAILPLSHERPVLLNGRSAGPDMIAVYGAGAEHEGANHAEARWAFLALQASAATRLLDLPNTSPILRPRAHAMLACDPGAWHRASHLLRSAVDVAVQDPEVFEVEEARRSLRSSILEVMQDLLVGASGNASSRILRSAPDRQRLIRAIEDYIRSNPGDAWTAEDLAAALGVPIRRLQRAIRTSFGISLQRYILLRRLTLLRIALRSASAFESSPREIILAQGFWNLGRLVRDYRALFSEDLSGLLRYGRQLRRKDRLPREPRTQ